MGKPAPARQSKQRSLGVPPKRRSSGSTPPEPTPMFWAVCGLAAFGIIGAGAAWVVRAKAAAEPTPVVAPPKAPVSPPVDLLVQSVAPQAKLLFRGQSLTLPYHGEVASAKTPEVLEISAPGFQGRRFWIKLDRARAFTVALPLGSGVEDATYDETLVASGVSRTTDPENDP
jgi:hypothetical protein